MPTLSQQWRRWLGSLMDPSTRLSVELAGLPGHMRLPLRWESHGKFSREHLIYLVVEGRMQAVLNGETATVSTGDLLWVRPGTAFACVRGNAKNLTVLRCRLCVENGRGRIVAPWSWRVWQTGRACLPWLGWLVQEADHPDSWSGTRLRCLFGGLFSELARMECAPPASRDGLSDVQRQALSALCAERSDTRATPRELARAAGLSYDYFSRCFKRSYGRSPRSWLVEQRIRAAMVRLAETDLRVGEISEELGYEDIFLFSRQFKAVTGMSPLSYRKNRTLPKPPAFVPLPEKVPHR